MKCTQEEFDSIKDLILDLNGNIGDFYTYPYLMTCWGNGRKIGNSNSMDFNNRKVYEYFDKDIFLKACDIEVDKVWKGSEMQIRYNESSEWFGAHKDVEFRLKPQTDYGKEIESLQDKAKLNGMKAIITFEKI